MMRVEGVKAFSVATLAIFLLSAGGYFYTTPSNILETHGREACNAVASSATNGRLYLEITGGSDGDFKVGGRVFVPLWLWPKDLPKSEKIWLDLPGVGQDGTTYAMAVPTFVSGPFKTELESTSGYLMDVEQVPLGSGTLRAYPFDSYWFGIQSANLIISTPEGLQQVAIPLELHVLFDGDSGWDAKRKIGVDSSGHVDTSNASNSQTPGACGLVVSRSLWYMGLVFSLLAVMVVPAIYVWRRPQEPAGLELIAAMLGVATIRTSLIGAPSSIGGLLPFDFALALIVGAVAFIPLWKASDKKAPEENSPPG